MTPPVKSTKEPAEMVPMLEKGQTTLTTEQLLTKQRNLGKNGVSAHLTLINFLRGMIGPGCFSVPLALKYGGLWAGFFLIFLIGVIACMNMAKLVRYSQHLCAVSGSAALNYGNMAEESFKHSFPRLRPYSLHAKLFVNACLLLVQLGVCSVCYIFMVDHAKEVLDVMVPSNTLSEKDLILIAFIPFCLLVSSKSFLVLSFVSVVGNFFMIVALIIIFQELVRSPSILDKLPHFTDFNGFMMAAGSIMYSFEGQAIVLPLENKLRNPSEMSGYTGVLTTGMTLTTVTYAMCGFFGYSTYGANVKGSITLNMPDTPLIFSVKVLLTMITFTGFLMQHYVVIEMYLEDLDEYLKGKKYKKWTRVLIEYGNRYMVVVLTMILALAVPNLADIIPLIGVTFGILLALILPPLIEWTTFLPIWIEKDDTWTLVVHSFFNALFILLGMIFMVFGLKSSIEQLMTEGSSSKH